MEGTKLMPSSVQAAENLQRAAPPATGAAAGGGERRAPPAASLHSVRKQQSPAKPWRKPAPLPIPPKVYRVHPRGFRELVQRLTGAATVDDVLAPQQKAASPRASPVQQSSGHHLLNTLSSTPAALWSSSSPSPAPTTTWEYQLPPGLSAAPPQTTSSSSAGYDQFPQIFPSAGEFPSPSLYSACLTWCSSPLLSPGSMACLEQSTVL